MFRRVQLESWHEVVPYIGFVLIAGAFLIIVVRALRMSREEIEHVAGLPFQEVEEEKESEPNSRINS